MTKVSSQVALTGAAVDTAADLIPVVDMSEAGAARNKKMTFAEFFLALQELVDDRLDAVLTEGDNVTITYDDVAGTITIAASPPGPGDISGFNEAVDDRVAALLQEGAGIDLAYNDGAGTLTVSATVASALLIAPEWTPNFTGDGEVRFRASVAMTVTEQATSGTGSVVYEKSTAAAPGTFSSTSSPITLEAGAWLKIVASGVTGTFAVNLKRTA